MLQEITCHCAQCIFSEQVSDSAYKEQLIEKGCDPTDLICTRKISTDENTIPECVPYEGFCYRAIPHQKQTRTIIIMSGMDDREYGSDILDVIIVLNYNSKFDTLMEKLKNEWKKSDEEFNDYVYPKLKAIGFEIKYNREYDVVNI